MNPSSTQPNTQLSSTQPSSLATQSQVPKPQHFTTQAIVYLVVDGPKHEKLMSAYMNPEIFCKFKIMPGILIRFNDAIWKELAIAMPEYFSEFNSEVESQSIVYPIFRSPLPAGLHIEGIAPEREYRNGVGILATVHEFIDYAKKHPSGAVPEKYPDNLVKKGDRVRLSYCPTVRTGGLTPLSERDFAATSRSLSRRIHRPYHHDFYLVSDTPETHPVSSTIDLVNPPGFQCRACPYYTDAHPTA